MFPFKPNKKYTTIAIYAAVTIAACILFGTLLFYAGAVWDWLASLLSSLTPLLYALMIAYLVRPLVAQFERLFTKIARHTAKSVASDAQDGASEVVRVLAIFASFFLLFAIIFCFFFFVFPSLLGDTKLLGERLVLLAEQLVSLINSFAPTFGFEISVSSLLAFLQSSRNAIVSAVGAFSTAFASAIFEIFIGLCLSVGILYFRKPLAAAVRRFGAAFLSLRVFRYFERIAFYSNRVFGKYLVGKIVECSIVGLIYLIVLPILGVPYPFLITVVMTITNFVPIIGAFLGGIPCGILILTGENPLLALWFAIIVLAIEQIDGNIIFPKVIGSIIELRAVWIMVAVALFGGFYGALGMFLSPPLFSIIYMLIKDATNHRLAKKGQPTDTEHYSDLFATTAHPRKRRLSHLFSISDRDHGDDHSKGD